MSRGRAAGLCMRRPQVPGPCRSDRPETARLARNDTTGSRSAHSACSPTACRSATREREELTRPASAAEKAPAEGVVAGHVLRPRLRLPPRRSALFVQLSVASGREGWRRAACVAAQCAQRAGRRIRDRALKSASSALSPSDPSRGSIPICRANVAPS